MLRTILAILALVATVLAFSSLGFGIDSHYEECREGYERAHPAEYRNNAINIGPRCFTRAFGESAEAVAIFVTAIATIALAVYTLKLGEDGEKQGARFERSICEAKRAATAMEGVSLATNANLALAEKRSAQQMRAYLNINIGGAVSQSGPTTNFAGHPELINNGFTPAHRVTYWAKADILPTPLPVDFAYPPPETREPNAMAMTLGPRQTITLSAIVPHQVTNLADIKIGKNDALYVWGVVSYDDIFERPHYVKFCQRIVWVLHPNLRETITVSYPPGHNETD